MESEMRQWELECEYVHSASSVHTFNALFILLQCCGNNALLKLAIMFHTAVLPTVKWKVLFDLNNKSLVGF